MILRVPSTRYTLPVLVEFNTNHWNGAKGGGCCHGPCSLSWPWWKLGALNPVKLHYDPRGRARGAPLTFLGLRLWLYTRWGSCYVELHVDRRELL